jgi:hypothetical protein
MTMRCLLPLLLLAGVAAPALAQTEPDNAPDKRACLQNRDIRAKDVSADHGYFARTPQGWWRNTGPNCSAYGPNRALATRSNEDRQCRGDLVSVFDPFSRIEFGSCLLGEWVRVDAPPKD